MANTAINMNAAGNSYLGQPGGSVAPGQIYNEGVGGPIGSILSGIGAFGQLRVGQSIVTAGFSNAGNNATSVITAVSTSSVQVTNSGAVAETNFGATGSVVVGRRVVAVRAFHSAFTFAGVADTGAQTVIGVLSASAITNKGCVLTASATIPAGTFSVLFDIYFDN